MEQLPQYPVHHRIGQMQGGLLGLLDMGFERVAEGGEFVDLGENSLPFLLGWNELWSEFFQHQGSKYSDNSFHVLTAQKGTISLLSRVLYSRLCCSE